MGVMNELNAFSVPPGETAAECLVARVEGVDEDRVHLLLASAPVHARRAVSCLLALLPGDTVSVIRDARGAYFVTSVLEREAAGVLEFFSPSSISVHSSSGLRLTAETSIEIDAGERVRLRAPQFEALIDRFAAFAKTLSVITGEALLSSKLARLCADIVDVAAQRIGVSARHSHRQIDGVEQLRCGHLDLQASELAQLRARTTLIKSEDLVKVDASQIQIG